MCLFIKTCVLAVIVLILAITQFSFAIDVVNASPQPIVVGEYQVHIDNSTSISKVEHASKSSDYKTVYEGVILSSNLITEKKLEMERGINEDGNSVSFVGRTQDVEITKSVEIGVTGNRLSFIYAFKNNSTKKVFLNDSAKSFTVFLKNKKIPDDLGVFSDLHHTDKLVGNFNGDLRSGAYNIFSEDSVSEIISWVALDGNGVSLFLRPDPLHRCHLTEDVGGEEVAHKYVVFCSSIPDYLDLDSTFKVGFDLLVSQSHGSDLHNSGLVNVDLRYSSIWFPFRLISRVMEQVLRSIYSIIGSWGFSIILLSILVKIVTLPISDYSSKYQSFAAEQNNSIKPDLRKLKSEYEGVELSEKILFLYKERNHDHFASLKGLLGLFIQIPLFYAVYNVIISTNELIGASFLWVDSLSLPDQFRALGFSIPLLGGYINMLPVIMLVVSSVGFFVKLNGKRMADGSVWMILLNIVIFLVFYSFSSALVLYWVTANVVYIFIKMVRAI